MTAEAYLDRGGTIQHWIELLKKEEEKLDERWIPTRSTFGMCIRRTGYSGDPMAEAVIRIQEEKVRIAERRERLEKELEEIKEVIRGVGDWMTEEVLRKRHLEGMEWKEIAAEMFSSESTVYRREKEGLAVVAGVLEGRGI